MFFSVNSRVGFEFKELWLISTIIFQKKVEIQCVFPKIIVEKARPITSRIKEILYFELSPP
jgi:hypothetical protein